jgi:hypothetical protein
MIKRIKDWLFNEKEWQEIQGMDDIHLKWEYVRLLADAQDGRYNTPRFRRICQRMAARFEAQPDFE